MHLVPCRISQESVEDIRQPIDLADHDVDLAEAASHGLAGNLIRPPQLAPILRTKLQLNLARREWISNFVRQTAGERREFLQRLISRRTAWIGFVRLHGTHTQRSRAKRCVLRAAQVYLPASMSAFGRSSFGTGRRGPPPPPPP